MFARDGENADRTAVTGVTSFAGRVRWYRRALGFNPLVRLTDRLEALAALAVLVGAVLALPIAMSAETIVYDSGMQTATEQIKSRHSVEALVVDGTGLPSGYATPAYVKAQWREGARVRTEAVVSTATIKPGDHMTVWLNDRGTVVAAPQTVGNAKLNAVAAAGTIWITIVVCCALAAFLARRALDRTRDRAWERELTLLAHNDDGWANRHA